MAGLFSKLFGSKKVDYSKMIPDPPQFQMAGGSQQQYIGGLQQLIDVFNRRSQGQDQFDYMSYVYGPQEARLRQEYGIGANPGDAYANASGVLPQTLASLNSRGLLDSGTSGVIEAQTRSNLANKLAELFGGAKHMQRQDIDMSLGQLQQLFPQRFQAQNIGNEVDYNNAMQNYNALLNRNAATAEQTANIDSRRQGMLQGALGLGLGAFSGGMMGAGAFGGASQIGAGGSNGFMQGAMGNLFGSNPYQQQQQMFQTRQPRTQGIPGVDRGIFSGGGGFGGRY